MNLILDSQVACGVRKIGREYRCSRWRLEGERVARHEHDREDLMREATALRRRVELRVTGESETLVAGFRDNGALSLFFGADPALHFDAEGRLRRAFLDGCLYRTQGDTLARLTRVRSESTSELRRHDLSTEELAIFFESIRLRLQNLRQALANSDWQVLARVPADWRFEEEFRASLESIPATELRLALRIPGKR